MADKNNKNPEKRAGGTEEWYKDFVDHASDLVQCVDSEGRFIYVNQAWLTTLKLNAEEVENITFFDVIHSDSMEHCMAAFKQVLTGKAFGEVEAVFAAKDGTPVAVEGSVSVKLDENGRFMHTRGIFRDVTERKHVEDSLLEIEAERTALLDAIPDLMFLFKKDGRFINYKAVNHSQLLFKPDEFIEKHISEVLPPYLAELTIVRLSRLFESGETQFYEYPLEINGEQKIFESRLVQCGDDRALAIVRDITERKQAEEAIRESEERFRSIIAVSNTGAWEYHHKNDYLWCSPEYFTMIGRNPNDFILNGQANLKETWLDLMHPDDRERAGQYFAEYLQKGSVGMYENLFRLRHADGTWVWIWSRGQTLRNQDGSLTDKTVGTHINITDRKHAEEALKVSEGKYREILSTIEEGYYEVDLAGNFVFFNEPFCQAIGYSRDEMQQGSYNILSKDPQEVFRAYNRVYKTGIAEKAFGWPVITKDGREIYVEVSITLRRNEAGEPIGFRGIARDVTERKLAEEKLREYEKLQQLLMKLATECINVHLEQVDTTVTKMLKAIGEFTQVDRVYIFKHNYRRRVTSNTHEWCAEGVPPEIDNLQEFPFERFIDFLETSQKGDIVHIPDVTSLPANHSMRSLFKAQGIHSMIMLPLFSEEVNNGFVGFDAVKKKRVFTEQEINLLKVLAEITSNVLTRQQAETNIRYMSFHDQLTGLYNRTFLEEEMKRLNTERQLPLAVIMADLNGLKLVNDTYGHKKGDEMLIASAAVIRSSCREEDIISRWGGDEFVMLLPQTTSDEASLICKRITKGCQNSFVEEVPLSIALGMATKDIKAKDLMDTLREAEDEMYKRKLTESRSAKSAMVTALLNTLAEKSYETEKHTREMQTVAQKIGAKLNLPDSELHRLELLITLHDIGKINISEDILTKEGSLTDDEWKAIVKHPEIGSRIAMATEEFAHVADDILAHHEHWDSGGYPQGLKGKKIPLLARITAIADAYEVMSNGRPYKKAMSENEIIAEFRRCSGTNFDPELVEVFLSILEGDG